MNKKEQITPDQFQREENYLPYTFNVNIISAPTMCQPLCCAIFFFNTFCLVFITYDVGNSFFHFKDEEIEF